MAPDPVSGLFPWWVSLLAALAWLGHAFLVGGALLPVRLRGGTVAWVVALALGVGVVGAVCSLLAVMGWLSAPALLLWLVVASTAGWIHGGVRRLDLPRHPALWVVLPLLLGSPVLAAMSPPVDTDEIYQHLALARRVAVGGALVGGFDVPDGSRPQLLHALFAGIYGLGGPGAIRLFHLGLVLSLVFGAWLLADARFGKGSGAAPTLVLTTSYTFLHEAGLAYNDLPAALWLLLGVVLSQGGERVIGGVFLGLAVTAKFTAGPAVAVAILLLGRGGLVTGAVATAVVVPWFLRNVMEGLHPLFPYAGWPHVEGFRFMYPEKYGVGHGWVDAILLPWNLLVNARVDSFAFYGQLSWGWAALGVGAAWAARRDRELRGWLLVLLVGFVAWGSSAQIMRFLLPLAGLAGLCGAAAGRWRWVALVLGLVSVPKNLGPILEEARGQFAVAAGREPTDAYLSRTMPAWPAVRFLRDEVPPDAPVALLFAWHGYYVEQPYILGSVEDHTPTRQFVVASGDDPLAALRGRGVRYALVGDIRFIRKSYEFLPEAEWKAQFVAPRDRLRSALETGATRLFAEKKWEVWSLDAPAPGD